MAEHLVVVLPGYEVARHLPALVPRLRQSLPDADLLLVDDGSRDGTADVASELGLEVFRHARNRGKGMALRTGFARALERGADAVLTLDADGQHPPEEAPRFLQAWRAGGDLVVGNRMAAPEGMPWLRRRTNEFTSWVVSRLAGTAVPDSQNGYRLIASPVLETIRLESERYDLESEILIKAARAGFRIVSVPVSTVYSDEESSIHPIADTVRFFRLVRRARRWRRTISPAPARIED